MPTLSPTARRTAAAALLLGPSVYLTAEAVSAAAWSQPRYSYVHNWISDLGSSTTGVFQGRAIDSPLHAVMNTGFAVQGLLLLVGLLVLSGGLPARPRRVTVALGATTTAGYLLLAVFHGSPTAAEDGTLALHFLGATLAILGANTLAILLGAHWVKQAPHRRLGRASIALGVIGLVGVVVLFLPTGTSLPSGLVERVSVYPAVVWQLGVAGQLLSRAGRPRRVPAARLAVPVR